MEEKARKLLLTLWLVCLVAVAGTVPSQAAGTKNVVTSAAELSGGKWVTTKSGVRYRKKSGAYVKNGWKKIGGGVYRFDSKGYRVSGWIVSGGQKYFAGKNGKLYVKKWLTVNKNRYYFQSSGAMASGKWLTIGGKLFYFLPSGRMAVNRMVTTGKNTYYVGSTGARVKNTLVTIGGKHYYFDKSGVRVKNTWIKSKGHYYYFGSGGAMLTDQWVGNYYVGKDGARLTDCVQGGYYLDASGKKQFKVFTGDYIFVGDSRMVGMKAAYAPSNTLYIAKESQGYTWLKDTAGPLLRNYLRANPKVKVVLALGVNDLGNVQNYISYYKKLMADFPDTEFYMLSVNPVDEAKEARYGYSVKNSQIEAFNKKLYLEFRSPAYINAYSSMKKTGFSTQDGLHYSAADYKVLYRFIVNKIG